MDRSEIVLAAMAASPGDFTPVHVQKLFFILDRKIPEKTGGPHFNFVPYDYGPFDAQVYREIEALAHAGLAEVRAPGPFTMKTFRLTPAGQRKGDAILDGLNEGTRAYLKRVSHFVQSKTFAELISAIYKAFPEMRVNSVFRET